MKWKTKEGKIMNVSDMTDTHLLNAINYLKTRIKDGGYVETAPPDIDMAPYYQHFTRQEILTDFGYYVLLAEKRKRKL